MVQTLSPFRALAADAVNRYREMVCAAAESGSADPDAAQIAQAAGRSLPQLEQDVTIATERLNAVEAFGSRDWESDLADARAKARDARAKTEAAKAAFEAARLASVAAHAADEAAGHKVNAISREKAAAEREMRDVLRASGDASGDWRAFTLTA